MLQLIGNLSLELFVASKNIFGKIKNFPLRKLVHFDILEMEKQMEE